jgi:diguanylate cyclase (GGDEF)-like protein
MGHVLKVIAYAMVYRAIFVAGVQDPYRRLARETSLLRSLIDAMPDLISYTDDRGRLRGANNAFGEHFRVPPAAVVGRPPTDFTLAGGGTAPAGDDAGAVGRFEQTSEVDGNVRHFDTVRTPYLGADGEALGLIEVSRDVTAMHEADQRIHELAFFDQLTGLPNRILLGDQAAEAFADPALQGRSQALVFLDLDDFQTTNDTLGHRVGDLLIAETAGRLAESAGPSARVARLGGDEFAVLASPCTLEEATALAARLLGAVDEPYRIEDYELSLTASAGVAMYPTDGTTFGDLAVRADAAMYRAKQDGRHAYRFFSGDMLADSAEHLQLLTDLRRAIAEDQFELHYQPQIRLADGTVAGLEALVRWRHPQRGLLMPDSFISLAEESGLILPIGALVLDRALADAAAWWAAGASELTMAVNVSAVQFVQADLVERVDEALARSGFPPHLLELEITESIAMSNPAQAAATIARLHERRISVAIDDFGTGYSSLAYLKGFAIDLLKIDRSFVRDLGVDANDTAIIDAIIDFAQALGIETVAEGVESPSQADFLREHGCLYGQGFWFHRPMPAADVTRLLQPVRSTT